MFTRLKNLYLRLEPGNAYRFSRGVAGGIAGSFFTLGGICKVPLKNFLFGYGSALTTAVLSIVIFAFKAKANYQNSSPDSQSALLNAAESQISTKLIVDQLQLDFHKTKVFLKEFNISKKDIKRLKNWEIESEDNLQDVLTRLFNALEFDIRKYPAAAVLGIMISAAHFMECLELQVYVNPDIFDYTNGATPANIGLSLIARLAITQGILEFIDVKKSFEHPSLATMSNTIFKAYDKYQIAREGDPEGDRNKVKQDEEPQPDGSNPHPPFVFQINQ